MASTDSTEAASPSPPPNYDNIPYKVTLALDIIVLPKSSEELPSELKGNNRQSAHFRCAFFNGQKITTEPVGKGTSWETITVPGLTSPDRPPTASKSKDAKAPAPAKPGDKNPPTITTTPSIPQILRHRTQVTVTADKDFAVRLHESPVLYVTMGCAPDPEGDTPPPGTAPTPAAKAPAKGGKDAPPATTTPTASGPSAHPFMCFIPVDCSTLLSDNHTNAGFVYGDSSAAVATLRASLPSTAPPDTPIDLSAILGGITIPSQPYTCPQLFKFMAVNVKLIAATQSQEVIPVVDPNAAVAPPAKGGKDDKKGGKAPTGPPAPQVQEVPINPPTLLCPGLRKELNPLVITVANIDNLPGLILPEGSDNSLRKYLVPDQYELQRKHCRPTYAFLKLPDFGKDIIPNPSASDPTFLPKKYKLTDTKDGHTTNLLPINDSVIMVPPARSVCMISPGSAAGNKSSSKYSTVVCTGLLPLTEFREAIRTKPLTIEIHDRDCIAYDDIQENARKAEGLGLKTPLPSTLNSTLPSHILQPPTANTPAATTPAPVSNTEEFTKLRQAILPAGWPWPLLPISRVEVYEGMATGAVPWPQEEGVSSPRPTSAKTAPAPPGKGAPATTPATATKGIIDIDGLFCSEAFYRISIAGEGHAHGIATFRLDQLLERTGEHRALLQAKYNKYTNNKNEETMKLKLYSGVSSTNRRKHPKVPEPLHKLSYEQTLIITPGAYGTTGTRVKLLAELAYPSALHADQAILTNHKNELSLLTPLTDNNTGAYLTQTINAGTKTFSASTMLTATRSNILTAKPLAIRKETTLTANLDVEPMFERIIVAYDYSNDTMLQSILHKVEEINSAAFPHVPSIRSHIFSNEELTAIDKGEIDMITGIHIIDHHQRIMIMEGLTGNDHGMAKMRAAIGARPGVEIPDFHLLANPTIRFHQRLYSKFGGILKDIRLRLPLQEIVSSASLYDGHNTAITPNLRESILSIRQLLDIKTLATAKEIGTFPTVDGMLAIENKFGDTVSLADMYGMGHPAAHALEETRGRLTEALTLASGHVDSSIHNDLFLTQTLNRPKYDENNNTQTMNSVKGSTRQPKLIRKGELENDNTAYLQALEASATLRANKNYIEENKQAIEEASQGLTLKRHESLMSTLGPEKATMLLSLQPGETLDTVGLVPPGGTVYMYSGQKLNTSEWQKDLMRQRLAKDKQATYTYGKEYGSLTVSLVDQAAEERQALDASKKAWKTVSGFIYPPHRTRDEDMVHPSRPPSPRIDELKEPWVDPGDVVAEELARRKASARLVADRPLFKDKPCPQPLESTRGCFGPKEIFKTVHATGDSLDAELEAARTAQLEEWKRKIVTGTTKFLGFTSHDGMAKVNRLHSMLRTEEPKKKILKDIKDGVKLPSGKRVPLTNPPPNMDTIHPYVPPIDPYTAITKHESSSTFLGRTSTGLPLNFLPIGPHDTVTGTSKVTHKPFITAALSPNAPVGGRPYIPTLVHGINTDKHT